MLSKIKIITTDIEDSRVIKLKGVMLIGYAANDFHEAILNAIGDKKSKIFVDLSELDGITCWGIGMLMYGYSCAKNADISFRLVDVPGKINDELVKVKIDKIIKQFDSVEDALNERYNLNP